MWTAGSGGGVVAQAERNRAAAVAAKNPLFDTMHPLLKRPGKKKQDHSRADRDPGNGRERVGIGLEADLQVGDLSADGLDARELRDHAREILGDRDRQEPD